MKNISISFILLIFLFSRCSVKDQVIIFEHIKDVKLENIEKGNIPYSVDFESDKKVLHLLLKNSNKIISYDLKSTKIIDTVNFKNLTKHPASFRLFHYINSDSIFLYSGIIGLTKHDSSFYLINNKSDVKKVYSLKNAPIKHTGNILNNTPSYMGLREQDLYVSKNNIYQLFRKQTNEPIGDSSYLMNNAALAGYIDTKENKYHSIPVDYIYLDTGMYYHNKFKMINLSLSHTNNPIFSFGYTPSFYEYDLEKKKLNIFRIKSKLIDTIPFSQNAVINIPVPSPKSGIYNQIFYNNYSSQYIRLLNLPYNNNYDIKELKTSVILFDTTFNYIAEGILPEGLADRLLFFDDDLVWFWNYKKTFKSNKKIIFSAYKLKVKKGCLNPSCIHTFTNTHI